MHISIPCPGHDEHDEPCSGTIEDIEVTVERGEWYGTDADGNRGVWRPGGIEDITLPETCSEGCNLDGTLERTVMHLAELAATEELADRQLNRHLDRD